MGIYVMRGVYKYLCRGLYMSGRPVIELMEEIRGVLDREKQLSVRQLSMRTGAQWVTVRKALKALQSLGIVKERIIMDGKRKTRLFSLAK